MKLTAIVCVVLLGLVLVPTDGRLKYGGGGGGSGRAELARDQSSSNVTREDEDGDEEQKQTAPPTGCHQSPAHYGWTLHRLSQQLAAAAAAATAAAAVATSTSANDDGEERGSRDQRVPGKRTSVDYGRELSADLYAQYPSSCACQTKYELLDLGYTHFPRYIVNAICQNRSASSRKCWRGSSCKEIPYKVRVLTRRADGAGEHGADTDHHSTLLPEPLRAYWRFKTVTIAAACQCSL